MQNKQQMLASERARHTYRRLVAQGVPAAVCRGTSGDDMNFFYSDCAYWSDHCLGWVLDAPNRPKICQYCRLVDSAPKHEFELLPDLNETGKEFRNSRGLLGQLNEPSPPRTSAVSELRTSSKHRGKGNKSDAAVKNKKTKKISKGKK